MEKNIFQILKAVAVFIFALIALTIIAGDIMFFINFVDRKPITVLEIVSFASSCVLGIFIAWYIIRKDD